MNREDLVEGRERLLKNVVAYFQKDRAVIGVFLGGSIPAGKADAYSDIDLKVVVEATEHARFVQNRLEMPKHWGDLLFNEWLMGATHCVSHFRPFQKIDVFYISGEKLAPSPWYGLPTTVLYDPRGIISEVIQNSQALHLDADADVEEMSRIVSKGLASAHEAIRRIRRGELFLAQSLIGELRLYLVRIDDWVHERIVQSVVFAKLENRVDQTVGRALTRSYVALEADAMEEAVIELVAVLREKIIEMHERFRLDRPLERDLAAVDLVLEKDIP